MGVNVSMVKVEKMSAIAAETEYNKAPERKAGQWKVLLEELHKSGEGAKVTGLSRGSAYSLARTAKEKGFLAKTTDKGTTAIVVPPVKKTK
jgi:hypothetical protein